MKLVDDMLACRTAELGGHLYKCLDCDFTQPHYNSCRNRCCPNCQALRQDKWIEERKRRVLPVGHHQVVFTLPSELRPLTKCNPNKLYELLMRSAAATLDTLADSTLDAQLAVTVVLHTWTRRMGLHPHVHCIVATGAFQPSSAGKEAKWIELRNYLFPVARMKALFRSIILKELQRLRDAGELILPGEDAAEPDTNCWSRLIRSLPKKDKWVVHIEPPLKGPSSVLEYLGRYTHRVAMSNERIIAADDAGVTFHVRGGETCSLGFDEFMQRFLQHVLPQGFRKIRHYGLYAPTNVNDRLKQAWELVAPTAVDDAPLASRDEPVFEGDDRPAWARRLERLTGKDPLLCPRCGRARLQRTLEIPRSPPGAIS